MAEEPERDFQRQPLIARARVPLALVLLSIASFGTYYFFFYERKTAYYSDRNSRVVASLAEQLRGAIDATSTYVKQAANAPNIERKLLYQFKPSDRVKLPSAVFSDIDCVAAKPTDRSDQYAIRSAKGLLLHFHHRLAARKPEDPLLNIQNTILTKKEDCLSSDAFATGSVELTPLVDQIFQQSSAAVFDSVFLLDSSGTVVYQYREAKDDDGAAVKVVRLSELTARRFLNKSRTLTSADLLSTSRQISVRLGDSDYELFSAPLRSNVPIRNDDAIKPNAADTWVLCGLVRASQFRSRSLAISVTLVSAVVAVVLLLLFSFPFLKVTLMNATHRLGIIDVVLLGICGILASSILTLAVLDRATYSALEDAGDEELQLLGEKMEANFREERARISTQLDEALQWAELRILDARTPLDDRNANLLKNPDFSRTYPYIQSFALVRGDGLQGVKWFLDRRVTPMVSVAPRTYFSGPHEANSDYLDLGAYGGRMGIQSVRSITTGMPEVNFGRRTSEHSGRGAGDPAKHARLHAELPVITMTVPDALSIGRPIFPAHHQFAIIDASGQVLFHSENQRNTVENFFAETDRDRRLRSAVTARRDEWMNLRYWGEDYRAWVHPMADLPWTIITFREKVGMRTLNTEALIATMIFLLTMVGALALMIALVLLFRPRYTARWLWPSPSQVKDYGALAVLYVVLLAASIILIATLRAGTLVLVPYWFVPFVLLVTYLRVAAPPAGLRRLVTIALSALLCVIAVASVVFGKIEVYAQRPAIGQIAAYAALVAILIVVAVAARTRKVRPRNPNGDDIKDHASLPLVYCGVAFLLILLTSAIPTTAFFRAAYAVELASFVKSRQMKLARDLQSRWWRIDAEYNDLRGENKSSLRVERRATRLDLYDAPSFQSVRFTPGPALGKNHVTDQSEFPEFIERALPHYSETSVLTRELIHDRASDRRWWWTFNDSGDVTMTLAPDRRVGAFHIVSPIPNVFMGFRGLSAATVVDVAVWTLSLLVLLAVNYAIAQFIARRVFLVDLVNPRWLGGGVLGLRHVICYPCDADRAKLLFGSYEKVNLQDAEDRKRAETLPQAFPAEPFERFVLIDGIDYRCATGERSILLRSLIERLVRNNDRTVVLRPNSMNLITTQLLQGSDGEAWSRVLSTFVWVSGYQLQPDAGDLTLSGPAKPADDEDTAPRRRAPRWRRTLRNVASALGFRAYVDQITDSHRSAAKAIREETENDPYLDMLAQGLDTQSAVRDQVLEEISERAETYYTGLWHTCTSTEKIVLMQLAQTGLVNDKMRKDLRRLLARGLVRRDPKVRVMNETFRRFVMAQAATTTLAEELDPSFSTDAWQRFRIPFFATVGVVTLFFVVTQHELFDATVAVVTGLTASLPAATRILTTFGDRATRSAR